MAGVSGVVAQSGRMGHLRAKAQMETDRFASARQKIRVLPSFAFKILACGATTSFSFVKSLASSATFLRQRTFDLKPSPFPLCLNPFPR